MIPRNPYYDDSLIADVLENRSLTLRGRGLLALLLTRQNEFVIARSLSDAVGGDRVSVFAAIRELEGQGFLRKVGVDRWEFSAVPMET